MIEQMHAQRGRSAPGACTSSPGCITRWSSRTLRPRGTAAPPAPSPAAPQCPPRSTAPSYTPQRCCPEELREQTSRLPAPQTQVGPLLRGRVRQGCSWPLHAPPAPPSYTIAQPAKDWAPPTSAAGAIPHRAHATFPVLGPPLHAPSLRPFCKAWQPCGRALPLQILGWRCLFHCALPQFPLPPPPPHPVPTFPPRPSLRGTSPRV
mmetsp:Transcript_18516/g.25651  ORF Transcript_18516/g.25651 Transcript_18516/m.25651 type:complete len:206 (+) Transcript_18516:288-905(+)